MDPDVVAKLFAKEHHRDGPLSRLTPREREVLGLMAEGRSNAAIAQELVITERAVIKHTSNIFTKLDLPRRRRTTDGSWRCSPTSSEVPSARVTAAVAARVGELGTRRPVVGARLPPPGPWPADPGSAPGRPVDQFAEDVRVTGVAACLLGQVREGPAGAGRVAPGERRGEVGEGGEDGCRPDAG